jgi:hypothetical protein
MVLGEPPYRGVDGRRLAGFRAETGQARRRVLKPGADKGVAALLTAANWVLAQLPGRVVEGQRGEFVQALSQAQNLTVAVQCRPSPMVRIYDGEGPSQRPPARSAWPSSATAKTVCSSAFASR